MAGRVTVLMALALLPVANAATRYVAQGGDNVAPYTNWANAARTFTAAVAYATSGDTILVSNGTYQITAPVGVNQSVAIKSVNGPSSTIFDGMNSNASLYFSSYATIAGITLTRFNSRGTAVLELSDSGGMVSNCVLKHNVTAPSDWPYRPVSGGGIFGTGGALVEQCQFISNTFQSGWVSNGTVLGTSGSAIEFWGIYAPNQVRRSIISHNSTWGRGGGAFLGSIAYSSDIENCLIYSNSAVGAGGGLYATSYSSVSNCTISENRALTGGGIYIEAGNTRMINTIVYENSPNNWISTTPLPSDAVSFTCTTSAIPGVSNITANPQFRDSLSGDYRLRSQSPCIDRGTNVTTSSTDLDGSPRVLDGDGDGVATVDMGCYEFWQASIAAGSAEPTISWPAATGYTAYIEHCTDLVSGSYTQYMAVPCVPTSCTVTGSVPGFYRVILTHP